MVLRAYRQIDRLAPGRRSFRTLWPLGPFTAGAAFTASARPSAFSSGSAGPTSAARPDPHLLDLLRELGQFFTVEFAVAVGVELHGMLDEPLW